ncbi:MAG: tetratricopeptide repeat protein [Bacteroidota bacterium]
MAKRKKKAQDETLVDIVEKKEQVTDFYESNQNLILGGLFAIVLLIGGIYAYNNFYKAPRIAAAIEEMAQAERMFERDSFALALNNPGGGKMGFEQIAENFSGTPTGNMANYYAGLCYLYLGQFKAAISYLEDYNPSGTVLPLTYYGVLGDAYSETGDMEGAIGYYEKATKQGTNEFVESYYLKKLGLAYEHQGNLEKAKATFEVLQSKYPNSTAGRDIEKYIARVNPK